MSADVANWVSETCSTIGAGDLFLIGIADSTTLLFRDVLLAGPVYYSIVDGDNREAGIGTFDGLQTIIRSPTATKVGTAVGTTTPIALSGGATVSCTFNTAAFNDIQNHITSTGNPHGVSLPALTDVTVSAPSNNEVLSYNGSQWVNAPGGASAAWGSITGTLSDQTDLQIELDQKLENILLQPIDDLSNVVLTAPANTEVLQFDGTTWNNVPANTVGVTDHTLLSNIGLRTHGEIDSHLINTANPHALDLDSLNDVAIGGLVNDDVLVWNQTFNSWENQPIPAGITDHADLSSIGVNTHDDIDTHLSDLLNPHNTSVANLSDTTITTPLNTDVLQFDGADWINVPVNTVGVTDHTGLTNIGVTTHADIDLHVGAGTIHFLESSINHANIQNRGVKTHVEIDAHLDDTTNPHNSSIANLIDTVISTPATNDILTWNGAEWINSLPAILSTFLSLTDTPPTYTGSEGDMVTVNNAGTGLEFIAQDTTGALTARYRFDSGTGGGDPGSGDAGMNNADPSLVTELYISQFDNSGIDRSATLAAVNTNDIISYTDTNTPDFHAFISTGVGVDNGTYWTFQVTPYNAFGSFYNNELMDVEIVLVPPKNFVTLLDTPDSYATFANQTVRVKQAEDGLEYYNPTYVDSDITADPGSDRIINMISLTQAEYDALTPVPTTMYVIVG